MPHIFELSSTNCLEKILRYVLLVQFAKSGFLICNIVYQLSNRPTGDTSSLASGVMLLVCEISQLFFPSYFGTALQHECELLTYETFKSNWVVRNNRFKMILIILTERTLRPVTIKAAGVFELGLITFLKVNELE